jgi:hypothetical protein
VFHQLVVEVEHQLIQLMVYQEVQEVEDLFLIQLVEQELAVKEVLGELLEVVQIQEQLVVVEVVENLP